MKRLMLAMIVAGLPMLATGSAAQVDDFLETDSDTDTKPEVKGAAKKGARKRGDKVKDTVSKPASTRPGSSGPGSSTPGIASVDAATLLPTINAQLLAASRQNQCNFKGDGVVLAPGCDLKAQNLVNAIQAARSLLIQSKVPSFMFEITGHTDTRGNPAANKTLTEKRAAAMVSLLMLKGVPANEISAVGMGSEQPLVKPDNTPAKQALNRRYELRVRI